MIVDKNRLLRNKAKKILKEKGELFGSDDMPAIQKMDIDVPQGEYHYRRRLNQNIKDTSSKLFLILYIDVLLLPIYNLI